jgi:hypothetical protein
VHWIPASCLEPEDTIFSGRDGQQPDTLLSCVLYICHSRGTIWGNSDVALCHRSASGPGGVGGGGSGCLAMQNALQSH